MKLLTKEILSRFAKTGCQEDNPDPMVVCTFFNPTGSGTWFATEYEPETGVFFGYVTGLGSDEWGYFSRQELESVRVQFGLSIERDIYFTPCPFSKVVPDFPRN